MSVCGYSQAVRFAHTSPWLLAHTNAAFADSPLCVTLHLHPSIVYANAALMHRTLWCCLLVARCKVLVCMELFAHRSHRLRFLVFHDDTVATLVHLCFVVALICSYFTRLHMSRIHALSCDAPALTERAHTAGTHPRNDACAHSVYAYTIFGHGVFESMPRLLCTLTLSMWLSCFAYVHLARAAVPIRWCSLGIQH